MSDEPGRPTEPARPVEPVEVIEPDGSTAPPGGPEQTEPAVALDPVQPADGTEPIVIEPVLPAELVEPAEQVEPAPVLGTGALFAVDEPTDPDQPPPDGAGGGDLVRRWPLLAGMAALALLGLSGVIWLLSSLPQSAPRAAVLRSPTPITTSRPSSPDPVITTASPWPTFSVSKPVISPPSTFVVPSLSRARTSPAPHPTTTKPRKTQPPPNQVRVPNVVGLQQSTATSILRAAGFKVTAVPVSYGGLRDRHRVVLESPPAGSLLARGSTVTIFVSTGIF
jgi:hypothetical protein